MKYNPNDNPDWSKVHIAITIDMATRGNFVLGSGETEREALECALNSIRLLIPLGNKRLMEDHMESLKHLSLNNGMLVRSATTGRMYNRLHMRYCDAKIHIYGRDRGYNGMSYILSTKYANFAEYCYYDKDYYTASRRFMVNS